MKASSGIGVVKPSVNPSQKYCGLTDGCNFYACRLLYKVVPNGVSCVEPCTSRSSRDIGASKGLPDACICPAPSSQQEGDAHLDCPVNLDNVGDTSHDQWLECRRSVPSAPSGNMHMVQQPRSNGSMPSDDPHTGIRLFRASSVHASEHCIPPSTDSSSQVHGRATCVRSHLGLGMGSIGRPRKSTNRQLQKSSPDLSLLE